MAQVLSLRPLAPTRNTTRISNHQSVSTQSKLTAATQATLSWTCHKHGGMGKGGGKFTCLFSNNGKKEQAKKALESALGGKKVEYEKWDKEIKSREEAVASGGGGGNSGGRGWFGWGGFGGSDGDRFWQEAQQASLTILGILAVYLIVAKGDVILAIIFNPLLFALRGTRTLFAFVTSKITSPLYGPSHTGVAPIPQPEVTASVSAKERVVGKWGSD